MRAISPALSKAGQPSGKTLENEYANQKKQHKRVSGGRKRDKGRKLGSRRWRVRGTKVSSRSKDKCKGSVWVFFPFSILFLMT